MTHYLPLLERYRPQGILVDTNILLLFFVGAYRRSLISSFKRTNNRFSPEDFDILYKVLKYFAKIVTTPHILAEVNSLCGQIRGPDCEEFFRAFSQRITTLSEEYVPSDRAAAIDCFPRFGLTDTVTILLGSRNYLVLTDDHKLAGFLVSRSVDVVNFNHLRQDYYSGRWED